MPVPYSDNLYSADDDLSDADHNHTELSPTDGYFHASSPFDVASPPQTATADYQPGHLNVPIVPNVMVEDPTLREQDPDAKAREAAEERRDVRKVVTGLLGFLVILAILLVILSAVDSGNQKRPGIDPSRPGDGNIKPPIDDDLRWQPSKECYNKPYRFVSFGTEFEFDPNQKLVIIQRSEDVENYGSDDWSPHVTGEVVIKPIEFPYKGEVDIEVLTNHQGLPIFADAERNTGRVEMVTPRKVKRDGLDRPPCIQIRITIRIPGGSSVAAADVSLTHLDLNILEGLKLNVAGDTRLKTIAGNIRTPTTEEKDELTKPSYQLNSREIYVSTMSGNIDGSYPLYDRLKVESVSGDVSIKVEPKPIDPKDPKPAELSVSTMSGNLVVKEPIKAALASPDSSNFPSRDYSVAVETKSGDVTADLAFTSYGRFYSISGNLNVDLWPLLHDAQQSTIIGPEVATDTKGGDTTLDLHEPHWAATGSAARLPVYPSSPSWIGYPPLIGGPSSDEEEGDSDPDSNQASGTHSARPLTLYSSHSSVSGDIHLRYPSAWEGYLKAQTVSGNQRFHGEGLEVTRRGKLPMAILEGYRGRDGHSDLRVESISGNQDFVVGEN
ncbi:unnamed protein product [Clonostachys rhizophaga]|uniref:Adhesin domain-containing protein n=1 Tax=Clonostachys rhizophaga TaxID=160324 RepID=A0A9N9V927_9HYPO|nr:unnamed protein product [Clonostachys rhizophaga]